MPILRTYFGVPMEHEISDTLNIFNNLAQTYTQYNFLDKAHAAGGYYNDLYLELPGYNLVINNKLGVGTISYFNEEYVNEDYIDPENIILTLGCKEPEPFVDANSNQQWDDGEDYTDMNQNGEYDDWTWDDVDDNDQYPSQNQYNEFNGQAVALRYITSENNCYLFGFPLSLMKVDDVKDMMTTILDELP
jgi:hypothetical protein